MRVYIKKFMISLLLGCSSGWGFAQQQNPISEKLKENYRLVWCDEFDAPQSALPDSTSWRFETGGHGWGNNELQYYVAGTHGKDTLALVSEGTLKIKALKKQQGKNPYVSIRMNTRKSWLYGYFEARAKVTGKRGSWAAFWMLPEKFKNWPLDGEIDIMEYVGYRPDVTQASVHTQKYNHVAHTEKTATRKIQNAETEFHTYGVEWTPEKITGYVDGEPYFTFENDQQGNKETWPFNVPFYLKLNLAIGGNWGASQGIDETLCPALYEIDYVRVYQKEQDK